MSGSDRPTGERQIAIDDTRTADAAALNFGGADDAHEIEVGRAIGLNKTRRCCRGRRHFRGGNTALLIGKAASAVIGDETGAVISDDITATSRDNTGAVISNDVARAACHDVARATRDNRIAIFVHQARTIITDQAAAVISDQAAAVVSNQRWSYRYCRTVLDLGDGYWSNFRHRIRWWRRCVTGRLRAAFSSAGCTLDVSNCLVDPFA